MLLIMILVQYPIFYQVIWIYTGFSDSMDTLILSSYCKIYINLSILHSTYDTISIYQYSTNSWNIFIPFLNPTKQYYSYNSIAWFVLSTHSNVCNKAQIYNHWESNSRPFDHIPHNPDFLLLYPYKDLPQSSDIQLQRIELRTIWSCVRY